MQCKQTENDSFKKTPRNQILFPRNFDRFSLTINLVNQQAQSHIGQKGKAKQQQAACVAHHLNISQILNTETSCQRSF